MIKISPYDAVNELDSIKKSIGYPPNASHLTLISAFLEVVDAIDGKYFYLSRADAVKFVSSRARIKSLIENIRVNPGYNNSYKPGDDPFTQVLFLLKTLPERPLSESFDPLPFLPGGLEKSEISRDIAEVEEALHRGMWKSATVISGSVLEAFLLYAMKKKGYYVVGKLPTLGIMLSDAYKAEIICESTKNALQSAVGYRNLIHADRVLKEKQGCSRGTAYIVYGAIDILLRELKLAEKN